MEMRELLSLAALGSGLSVALLLLLWGLHRRTRNASWVDVGWAAALGMLALLYAALGDGYPPRRLLVAGVVGIWSLRLTSHLLRRLLRDGGEDPRYAEMRRRWGGNLHFKFFALFVGQGLLDVFLGWSFLVASVDPAPSIHWLTWVGATLAVFGMLGESVADAQLRQFKADAANRGTVCRVGLWGWSRHPNYFFDWLVWCGFALLGLASPLGALGVAAPLVMLYFLTRVTGIAATEAHAVQSRGEAYRQYQREVSAFVPWPPRPLR